MTSAAPEIVGDAPRDAAPPVRALSAADTVESARRSGPDRLPDRPVSASADTEWWYPPAEFELALLGRIVRDGFAASDTVHYSDNYGRPAGRAVFRRDIGPDEHLVVLRSTGTLAASIDGRPAALGTLVGDGEFLITVRGGRVLELVVECPPGVPAAVGEPVAHHGADWTCRLDGETRWRSARSRPGTALAPHLAGEPVVEVPLRDLGGGLWQADAPVLGAPVVGGDIPPRFRPGESREEALAEAGGESRAVTVRHGDTGWTTSHPLAIRFLRVDDASPATVGVAARVRPVARRGAFHCSDDRLNRIWATSAYTLRLCMQGLVVDGIKRDRMPWAGDQALAVLANAYGFADAPIVRDGLVALGRVRDGHVNGIADYSLWWVIAQHGYLEHFGDLGHAAREADQLQSFMESLADDVGRDGVFRPRPGAGAFVDAGPGSVFIDWGVTLEAGRDPVALQMLWYRALRSAEHVLAAVGHPGATGWGRTADLTRATLLERGWDAGDRVWREYLDDGPAGRRGYANLLAVLAGLVPEGAAPTVLAEIAGGDLGTPFMRSFALLARAELGDSDGVVADIADRWGRMLDAGAQTFWEEFDDGGSPLAMYGRPFGKSLCHGWAAGPAALLPRVVLGVRPVRDGWSEFAVSPRLGALDWASAVVPVPGGEIFVTADQEIVRVDVPAGHALVRGDERTAGPATVEFSAPSTAARRVAG